jgi:negative regulator of flagellin synthesis FlgM
MRIDSYGSLAADALSSQPNAQSSAAQNDVTAPSAGSEDRTTLTSSSASVESLVSTAMNSPEVRQDKVDSLRQAIASGQYQLDPAAIASSMLKDQD